MYNIIEKQNSSNSGLSISSVKFSKLKKEAEKTYKTTINVATMITTGHEEGI